MSLYKTILVALGPERKLSAAVHRGIELARRNSATLHLCVFDYQGLIDTARAAVGAEVATLAEREFIRERLSWVSIQAAALADQGLRIECDVVWAPVLHEAVLGKALEIGADLVLRDTAVDRHAPPRLHPSPADWKLLRLLPCALMLVHPDSAPASHHLLAAIDVTSARPRAAELNERLLGNTLALAQICEADVDVVSAYSYVPLESDALGYAPEIYELVEKAHKSAFESFMKGRPLAADRQHRIFGEPSEAIAQCAAMQRADLVVIGAAYHSGWDRLLFGSTSESLLRQISCDVLILKPDGFVEELGRHLDLAALRTRYRRLAAETPGVERE